MAPTEDTAFDKSKYLRVVSIGCLYLTLSICIAFLCHRLYFHETPVAEVIKSVFAGFVFVATLVGLITWTDFRVYIFLLIPKLFNVNGRTVLIAYISYLTLSGPVWNTKRNIGVMSTTLVCSFEEIRTAASDLIELMKEPVVYIKHLIDTMEQRAKRIFAQLADDLRQVKDFAQDMIQYFRRAIKFLRRLTSLCDDKLGTPIGYCMKTVKESINRCEVDHDNSVCSPMIVLYAMCAPLAALNIFCIHLDYEFLDIHFVDFLEKGFKSLLAELRVLVDVDVDIDGDFEVITNKTKTYHKIREDVARAFGERTDRVYLFLELSKIASILLSFYLFFSIYRFKYNYLHKVHYQNRYLLRSLSEINELRMARGDPSVFPLNYFERRHFIVIHSWRVTYWEVIQAIRGIANVMAPCFYVACITFGDYALYYLLLIITENSHQTNIATAPVLTVDIAGEGFVADFMHSIVETYEPIINGFDVDFGVCAPRPHKPDDGRMILLISLCVFCLIQSVLYPFAARAMHLIMELYYEEATKRRMAWLYNDILRRRKTMQMMVYERVTGQYGDRDPIPVMVWLRSEWGEHWICQWLLGREQEDFCMNCAKTLTALKNKVGFLKCPTYGCSGVYCRDCIKQLNSVCILCKKTVDIRIADQKLALEGVDASEF